MADTDIEMNGGGLAGVTEKLLRLGSLNTPLRDHPQGGKQVLIVPDGFLAQVLDNPDHPPSVTRRTPSFFETDSFIDYVNAFKRADQTRIFVHPESLKAVAVIDYDTPATPDRGTHRASLQLALSPEWKTWAAAAAETKSRGFTQEQFAEFLEEHGVNVVTPTAAELLELVSKMQITRQVNYKRSINLQDGRQQFTYVNDSDTGSTEFPARLELGIPVFNGGELYKVTVLLRYRLQDGGSLRFAMIIHRADVLLQDAIKGDIAAIQTKTEVPVHIGAVA